MFLAEPYHLADWWPGISGVEPDRRGLAPGARWKVVGPGTPSLFRKPQMTGNLVVLAVEPILEDGDPVFEQSLRSLVEQAPVRDPDADKDADDQGQEDGRQ